MSADNFQPRSPDYTVNALDKKSELKGPIGVAWNQPDGTIRIKLNPFTVLDTSRQDLVITLFKKDFRGEKLSKKKNEDEAPIAF